MRPARLFLVACALTAALAACSDDSGSSADTTTTTTTTTAPSSTTTAGSQSCSVTGATISPQASPRQGDAAFLTALRVGRQECADRIVFDFRGDGPPGYAVEYRDGPFTLGESDRPVSVAGEAFLVVTMMPASGVDLSGDGSPTYTGPESIVPQGLQHVREIRRLEDFEAVLVWVIGLDTTRPFEVRALSGPSRIYIDVADA